jgi:hypothetical protein
MGESIWKSFLEIYWVVLIKIKLSVTKDTNFSHFRAQRKVFS